MSKQVRIDNVLFDFLEANKLPRESVSECIARLAVGRRKLKERQRATSIVGR